MWVCRLVVGVLERGSALFVVGRVGRVMGLLLVVGAWWLLLRDGVGRLWSPMSMVRLRSLSGFGGRSY